MYAAGFIRHDDEIFEHTLREFPEFAAAPHTGLIKLEEDWMKSKEGKERWRGFINACVSPSHTHPTALIAQSPAHAHALMTQI
jgi:polysaccharide biosynthesis protein